MKQFDHASQFNREANWFAVTWASGSLLGFNFFSARFAYCIDQSRRGWGGVLGKWAKSTEARGWIVYSHKNNLSIGEDAWCRLLVVFCCPKQMAFSCYWSRPCRRAGGSSGQGTESKSVHSNCLPNHPSEQRKTQCESATNCICMLSK